jgi:hypothetical protein
MHFIASLTLTGIAMVAFCFGQELGIPIAGPNSFGPGLFAIWIIGVILSVAALRADREKADRDADRSGGAA